MVGTRQAIGAGIGLPLIKGILKWFFIILVIAAVFYLIYFGIIWNFFTTGGGSVIVSETRAILEKTKIGSKILDTLSYIRYYREHPAEGIFTSKGGWEANVDANVANRNLGVKIEDFSAVQSHYYPGQDIKALGRIRVNSLKENTKVVFNCSLGDYKGEEEVFFEREDYLGSESNAYIFRGPGSLGVTCFFLGGVDIEPNKDVSGKYLRLYADYEFITDNYLPIYILNKIDLDSLDNKGENPFKYYGTTSRYLDVNDRSTAHSPTYGPMKLESWVHNQQPLTDGTIYTFGVKFKSGGSEWSGNFKKLNHLYVFIPEYFELVRGTGGDLEEAPYAETPIGYKAYELDEKALERANNICAGFDDVLDKRCAARVVNGITFTSEFKIYQVIQEGLYTEDILLRADYIYRAYASDSIIIQKAPELV